MTPAQKKQNRANETRIERAYRTTCAGIQIDLMDIGKVFAFGHKAIERGEDQPTLEASILAYVKTIAHA